MKGLLVMWLTLFVLVFAVLVFFETKKTMLRYNIALTKRKRIDKPKSNIQKVSRALNRKRKKTRIMRGR